MLSTNTVHSRSDIETVTCTLRDGEILAATSLSYNFERACSSDSVVSEVSERSVRPAWKDLPKEYTYEGTIRYASRAPLLPLFACTSHPDR